MDGNHAPHCRHKLSPGIGSSPSVCLGPAAPSHFEGIKAYHISASSTHGQDLLRYITTSTSSMTNKLVSGIFFFPEYTSASTATLWIRIKRQIFGISSHRQNIRWPLSGLSPHPKPPSTPTTLFQTTAYTACIPCLALGDSTPPSGPRIF